MLNVTFMTINQFVIPALPRHDTHQTARSSMPKYSTCFFFRGGLSSTVTDISKEIALVTQLLNLVSARVERKASSRLQSDSPEPGCGWWWLMELFPSFKVSHSFWLGIALVPFDTQLAQRRCSTFFVCHSHFHTNIRNAPPPEQRPPGLHLLTFFKINFLFDLFGVWWSSPAVKNELFDKVGNMTSSLKSSSYILIYFKILSKWEMLCVLTTVLPLITVRVCVCVWFFVFQRQLFGIEPPASTELRGWRKYLNSYTIQGRRNVHKTHACTRWILRIWILYTCVTCVLLRCLYSASWLPMGSSLQ